MRLVDLQNALPFILAALVAVGVFGASFTTLLIIIAIFSWGTTARQIRGEILQLKQMGLCQSRPYSRSIIPSHHIQAPAPRRNEHPYRRRHSGNGSDYPHRSHPQFSRCRHPTAQARLGQYGLLRQKLHRLRMVDRRHTRGGNRPRRRVAQLPRRLAARLLRPAPASTLGVLAASDTVLWHTPAKPF